MPEFAQEAPRTTGAETTYPVMRLSLEEIEALARCLEDRLEGTGDHHENDLGDWYFLDKISAGVGDLPQTDFSGAWELISVLATSESEPSRKIAAHTIGRLALAAQLSTRGEELKDKLYGHWASLLADPELGVRELAIDGLTFAVDHGLSADSMKSLINHLTL